MCFIAAFIFESLQLADPAVDKYLIVIDMCSVQQSTFDLQTLKAFIPIFGNYFPDVLSRMIAINCSAFLKIGLRGLLLLASASTSDKIEIHGQDLKQVSRSLCTLMPKEQAEQILRQNYN